MPPITDPTILAQIAQQQQQAGTTLAGPAPEPPPYYPPAPPPPRANGGPMINPFRQLPMDRTKQIIDQSAATGPADLRLRNAQAAKAEIDLKKEQEDWDLKHPKAAAGVDPNAVGLDAIRDLPPSEQEMVKAITQGRLNVSSYSLARNPKLYALTQRAFQLEPGTDMTTFQRRQAAFQKFMSNPNSPMVRVNQALQHLDRFHDNALKLDNYHSGFLGSLANYPRAAALAVEKDPRYQAFATDRDALATELAAAFQGSGQSALADRDHWKQVLSAANSPESFESTIKEAVGLLGGRVEASNAQFKQAVGANADFYDLMSPGARKVYQKFSDAAPPAPADDTPPERVLSTTHKTVDVPAGYQLAHKAFLEQHPPGTLTPEDYKGLRQKLDSMFLPENERSHLSDDEVNSYVKQYNEGHGGVKIPAINVPLSNKGVLGTSFFSEKGRAEAAASRPGVTVANFGNALAMGLPELTMGSDRHEMFRQANDLHPGFALGGDIAGSILPIAALESGVIKAGTKIGENAFLQQAGLVGRRYAGREFGNTARSRLVSDIIANQIYGGSRGFNADEGDRGSGFLKGLAAGTGGAVVGNVAAHGVTPFLSEATGGALKQLKGVKLTTLQKLGLGKVEDAASGTPITHGARLASVKSYNVEQGNRALGYIGESVPKGIEPGTELNNHIDQTASNFYSRLSPKINGTVDSSWNTTLAGARAAANTSEKKALFSNIKDAVGDLSDKKGNFSGESYRTASGNLRKIIKSWTREGATADEQSMAQVAMTVRKDLKNMVKSKLPADVAGDLENVEKTWTHKMIIEDASRRAKQDNFVYGPGQYLTSLDKLSHKGAFSRGKGFDQGYAESAARVMGARGVPKLSLKEMAILYGPLAVATYGAPTVTAPILTGIYAGAYGPVAKQVVQKVLSGQRPSPTEMGLVREILKRGVEEGTRKKLSGD
jgi:hypothetical protein